ncbi:MAG: GIY-YIG nuclease family protein [Chitinophagaceae bacterium]|nr:GIY-YIG nuclease family protein [Chitinophagaceae bacterium]
MPFFVYIIYSSESDKFYIGQTNDFTGRLERHNSGFEKSTSPYRPWVLKCLIQKENRSEAMILEKKLKNLNRIKLLQFIEKYG